MSEQAPPRRSSVLPTFLMIAALAASCAIGGYYLMSSGGASRMAETGFDVARVEAPAPVSGGALPARAAPQSSPMPIAGMQGLSMSAAPAPDVPRAAQGGASQAPAQGGGGSASDRAREKEFLAKHGAELQAYERNVLMQITERHRRNNAVVRRVDAEFGALPRYMALRRQYEKDLDPFAFARGAIALPEVRQEIAKCMGDPGVWKAAVGMINEALRNPPPKSIYDEAKHFMTNEESVSNYMAGDFMNNITANKEAATASFGPDTDLSGLKKLAGDIMPGGAAMAGMPAGLDPAALGAMAGQKPPRQ